MSQPFLAYNRDTPDGEPERIPAADFDWETLYSSLGETVEDDAAELLRKEGARAMLSHLIEACTSDLTDVSRDYLRAGVVGIRFMCVAHAMRCGALNDKSLADIGRILGVSRKHVCVTMKRVRGKAFDAAR